MAVPRRLSRWYNYELPTSDRLDTGWIVTNQPPKILATDFVVRHRRIFRPLLGYLQWQRTVQVESEAAVAADQWLADQSHIATDLVVKLQAALIAFFICRF